jgi:parallel beta-helix repeat protein
VIAVSADRDDVLIHRGSVRGGSTGVLSEGTNYRSKIRLRDLTISGQQGDGILVNKPGYVEVVGCRVGPTANGSGIFVSTDSAFVGRFADNYVVDPGDSGIRLYHLKQGEVVQNIIHRELQNDFGILLTACEASRIDGNRVSAEVPSGYSGITLECNSSVVARNSSTGHGAYGIGITGHGNRVFENEVSFNLDHGFFIGGSNNMLTGNTAHGNGGRGIYFVNSNGHAYSNNMLRGNSAPVGGGDATDAGGNVY